MVVTWKQINKTEEAPAPRSLRVFIFGLLLGGLVALMISWVLWR